HLVGEHDELVFDGGTGVMNADGALAQRAPAYAEDLVAVTLHAQDGLLVCPPQEICPLPEPLASVYQALVLGLRDYVEKNGFKGVVLGLSGGIDSAVT